MAGVLALLRGRLRALRWWRTQPPPKSIGEIRTDEISDPGILPQLVAGLPEVIEANRAAIGDAWPIASNFAEFHYDLLRRLSRAAGSSPTDAEQAVLLLGTHGLNVLSSAIGGTLRGEFDTTLYFVRAHFDTASFLLVCSHDTELARRWRHDELDASDARKRFVTALRDGAERDLADTVDRILRTDADAANEAAHVGLTHANKLLRTESDGNVRPIVGGQVNADAAKSNMEAFLGLELHVVTALASSFVAPADDEEQRRLNEIVKLLRDWRSDQIRHSGSQRTVG